MGERVPDRCRRMAREEVQKMRYVIVVIIMLISGNAMAEPMTAEEIVEAIRAGRESVGIKTPPVEDFMTEECLRYRFRSIEKRVSKIEEGCKK